MLRFFRKNTKILTIGESTITGVGVRTHQEGFTETLATELAGELKINIDWNVSAKSGDTTKRIQEKMTDTIPNQPIDFILIGIGGIDAFELSTPKNWKKDVSELIESIRLKFKTVPILFINMPPIKELTALISLIKYTIGNLLTIHGEEL